MSTRIRLVAASLAALLAVAAPAAFAQTAVTTAPSAESTQVLGLAPQLVAFAGSTQNFQALVDGLATGQPVTLVTQTPDGFTQTVTFTPVGTLTPLQIAQTLEAARQQLITRGIAAPTAQQIGITLAGGALPTSTGNVQVTGLVPVVNGSTPSSSTGAGTATPGMAPVTTARAPATAIGTTPLGVSTTTTGTTTGTASPVTTTTAPTGGVTVQVTPGPAPVIGAAAPSASTGSSTAATGTTTATTPRFTSDTPTSQNLSNSPTPSVGAAPSASSPNGLPSPALQLQQRR